MEKLVINGKTRLQGDVTISGAKNSAVAILPATLLIDGVCTIDNLPNISDVRIYCDILQDLGAKITWNNEHEITDHVAAWSKGGATDINNCQMLCKTHNRAKGNK